MLELLKGGAAEVLERGQARGAAKDLKLSRGAGGGLETVRKDFAATQRRVDGGTAEVTGYYRLEVRGFCKGQAQAAVWKATGRRLEEPLKAARTRSQPEVPLRAGKATGHWTLQGGMPSSWLEWA